ncbi:hypothetical protein P8452_38082 [Trifolium repens]|nr:hypothetical protein P8452_38082 [Trifolium repens]
MDNNNNYDEHDGMGFMENDVEVGFVNEEEKHEQVAAYVEVQFANEEAEGEQLAGDNENEQNNLSRSVKELTVLVNKVVDEITDLKHWVVTQYSTHFEELQTIIAVKKSLAEISALKAFMTVHTTARFNELETILRSQQPSLDVIRDSLKMIEVGVSTKPRTDSPRPTTENTTEKRGEVSNPVITIEDEKEEEQDPSRSKGKRKAVESDYESELDKDKEVANTDLVFSDGDYEFHADDVNKKICQTINNLNMQIKQAAPKPLLPDAWTSIDKLGKSADLSNPMRFSNILSQLHQQVLKGKGDLLQVKEKKTLTGSVSKRCKSVLPKGIKWNFPVTSDMKLDFAELQAIAYVYHPDKDKSKRLVSSRGIEAYRADFDTLTPGNMINHKIVTLVCMRSTWMQESYNRGAVWFLPPAFADDVFLGKTIEELIATYCKDWMPSYPRLKYIYVPINTSSDHWFLMVISMQLQTIYHLNSYCGIGDVKPRRATISIISRTLECMVSAALYGTTFLGRSTEFNEWPIEEAHGIPNCGHSNNAAVWVIDWMDMDQCFTPNIQGELKENMIRVKTASNLVLGVYNDLWDFIEEEAKNFWELISN